MLINKSLKHLLLTLTGPLATVLSNLAQIGESANHLSNRFELAWIDFVTESECTGMTWLVCMKMVTRSVYLNRFRTCRRFTPKEKKMKEPEKRNTEAKVLNRVRRRPSRHSSMFAFLLAAWLPLLPRCCLVTDSLLVVCSLCDLGIWDYVVWKSWGRERVELVRWDSRVELKGGG